MIYFPQGFETNQGKILDYLNWRLTVLPNLLKHC